MKVHYSSDKHTWETPDDLYKKLDSIFRFNLDSCAEPETAKNKNYFTIEDNALNQDWTGVVWCNPPYGKEQIKFIEKAFRENKKHETTIVLLIPARPDTKVWQNMIFKNAKQICFIKGRIKFKGAKYNCPFPCALVTIGESKDLSEFGYCYEN